MASIIIGVRPSDVERLGLEAIEDKEVLREDPEEDEDDVMVSKKRAIEG